jgi:hypothetical protein
MGVIGKSMPRLFPERGGVLAGFDTRAGELFGMPPRRFEARHGAKRCWDRIAGHEDSFHELPLMPERGSSGTPSPIAARSSRRACRGADGRRGRGCAGQPGIPGGGVVTTMARAKRDHMESLGDVLVDDLSEHMALREEASGVFVHRRNAKDTLDRHEALGLEVRR